MRLEGQPRASGVASERSDYELAGSARRHASNRNQGFKLSKVIKIVFNLVTARNSLLPKLNVRQVVGEKGSVASREAADASDLAFRCVLRAC